MAQNLRLPISPYAGLIRDVRGRFVVCVSLQAVAGVLELLGMLVLFPILDSAYKTGELSVVHLINLGTLLSASAVARRTAEAQLVRLKTRLEASQRQRYLSSVLTADWRSISNLDQVDIDTAMVTEVSQSIVGVGALASFFGTALTSLALLTATVAINPALTSISLLVGLAAGMVSRTIAKKQVAVQEELSRAYIELNRKTSSIIWNLKYLRVSGHQSEWQASANEQLMRISKASERSMIWPLEARLIVELTGVFLLVITMFMFVRYESNPTAAVVFMAVFFRLMPRVQSLQGFWLGVVQQQSWAERWSARVRSVGVTKERIAPKAATGETFVELINAGVRFSPKVRPLGQVNLHIREGDRVGVVGPSGTGKSTLVDLLTGLIEPDSGEIQLGSQFGGSWTTFQQAISVVPQHPPFVGGTLRENLNLLQTPVPDEELSRLLQDFQLARLVTELNKGLDEQINPNLQLSGGQRQRLALVRALARKPKMLVLDEATSAMDFKLEQEVVSKIAESVKTLIVISHKAAPLSVCQKVYELRNGVLCEIDKSGISNDG